MSSFADITRQVYLINDLILSDMICGNNDDAKEIVKFSEHTLATKSWFAHISYTKKKAFVLALLKDVRSIWALSLILKSIWSCRPKDAIMSVCQSRVWSSYDQVPMDHDRTALPLSTLAEVMTNDRMWFLSLEPKRQVVVLSELLMVAGGPIMWEALKRAQQIYDQHVVMQTEDLQECVIVQEPSKKIITVETIPVKNELATPHKSIMDGELAIVSTDPSFAQAQKELDTALEQWTSTVKRMKDSMKLEELELTYKSGIIKKIWKVQRSGPETVETVDFIQLLPSSISKCILIKLPTSQFGDCARVNKYWSFLIEEIRAEMLARQKINMEMEKMRENIIKHDKTFALLSKSEFEKTARSYISFAGGAKTKGRFGVPNRNKPRALPQWTMTNKPANKSRIRPKTIRNMTELNERLEIRGAADENIWKWCKNVLKISEKCGQRRIEVNKGGILSIATEMFPGPMVTRTVKIPFCTPLVMDPTHSVPANPRGIGSTIGNTYSDDASLPKFRDKRYTLWSEDFASLYPICKISSYMSPF